MRPMTCAMFHIRSTMVVSQFLVLGCLGMSLAKGFCPSEEEYDIIDPFFRWTETTRNVVIWGEESEKDQIHPRLEL